MAKQYRKKTKQGLTCDEMIEERANNQISFEEWKEKKRRADGPMELVQVKDLQCAACRNVWLDNNGNVGNVSKCEFYQMKPPIILAGGHCCINFDLDYDKFEVMTDETAAEIYEELNGILIEMYGEDWPDTDESQYLWPEKQ